MAIPRRKYMQNDSGRVAGECRYGTGCDGQRYATVPTDWYIYEYTEMTRQRVRPEKLTPTSATYVHNIMHNNSEYGCVHRPGTSNPARSCSGGFRASYGYLDKVRVKEEPSDECLSSTMNAARNRLNEHGSSFGETIATFRQTTNMVTNRVLGIAELALALRKGDFKKIGSIIKGDVPGSLKRIPASRRLADGWLELEFGWKPLVEDVYTGLDLYRNKLKKGDLANSRANCKSGGFGPKESSNEAMTRRILNNGANTSVKLYATVSNPTVATLNDMGVINPALIGWQLLPFSFVVDWFYPVSSTLAAMTASAGYDVERACVVTERFVGYVYEGTEVGDPLTRTVTRSVVNSAGRVNVGPVHKSKSLWHLGTALALLRQRFR